MTPARVAARDCAALAAAGKAHLLTKAFIFQLLLVAAQLATGT
jgi:hypothetical protein